MSINEDARRSIFDQAWVWVWEGWLEAGRCLVLPYMPELYERYVLRDEVESAGDGEPGQARKSKEEG